jgi:hypothetical protein
MADSLVRIPHSFANSFMSNEEDELRKQLRRRSSEQLQITMCRETTIEAVAKARVVVLTSHVDRARDGGAVSYVAANYLRYVLNFEGPIVTAGFSRPNDNAQRLILNQQANLFPTRANATVDEIIDQIMAVV